jgi:hypothetical protein
LAFRCLNFFFVPIGKAIFCKFPAKISSKKCIFQ